MDGAYMGNGFVYTVGEHNSQRKECNVPYFLEGGIYMYRYGKDPSE